MKHIAFAAILLLASCGSGPLSLLTGGGPNVAANVQAGAENNQTIGLRATENNSIVRPRVQGDFDNSTQIETVNETPVWLVLVALLGWLLPSPGELWRQFLKGIGRARA